MKKTIHIGDNGSWEGCMKFSMHGLAPKDSYVIMGFDYSFCTSCLPRNLTNKEIERCLNGTHTNLYNNLVLRFADIDLKAYDKIVIWHTYDSNSLLLLYFFSTIVEGDLYHCIIKGEDENMKTGGATPEDIHNSLDKIKLLSKEERTLYNEIYTSLLGTEGVPKIAEGYQIICKSKDFVKSLLMKHIIKTPKPYVRIIGETISEFPKEYLFDSLYLECLIQEMIEEGILKPHKIIREKSKRQYPIGGFYNRRYLYNGEDMGKWYGFSITKGDKPLPINTLQ